MKASRENPIVNAQVRDLLWLVPIHFPNSRRDYKGESIPSIKIWLDAYLEEDWSNEIIRGQIIDLVILELFGPSVE